MRTRLTRLVITGALVTQFARSAAAEEPPPPPPAPPAAPAAAPAPKEGAPVAEAPKDAPAPPAVKWYDKIEAGGMVDAYFTGNFNGPSNHQNAQRPFDFRANELSFSYAELNLTRKAEPVGFRLDLGFGPLADSFHGAEPAAPSVGFEAIKNIQQAYVSWKTPFGLQLDLGKMVTPTGNEVTESQDNWNYSRSYTYYTAPYYHSGLKLSYGITEQLTAIVCVFNGWNNVVDNNDGKTFHAGLVWSSDFVDAFVNWLGGPEGKDDDGNWRQFIDGAVKVKPIKDLGIQVYGMYVNDSVAPATPTDPSSLVWWGVSGMVRYAFAPAAAAVRAEYFVDDGPGTLTKQKVFAVTGTGDYNVAGALLLRTELRFDTSDAAVFFKEKGGTSKDQVTLSLSAVAYF